MLRRGRAELGYQTGIAEAFLRSELASSALQPYNCMLYARVMKDVCKMRQRQFGSGPGLGLMSSLAGVTGLFTWLGANGHPSHHYSQSCRKPAQSCFLKLLCILHLLL